MKINFFFPFIMALVFAPLCKVSAQTYQGDLPGTIYSSIQLGGNNTLATATVPTGTGTLNFTIDPVASTFQFNSVSYNNLILPQISTTYAVGFGNLATISITFNPLNFVLNAPPPILGFTNPSPLTPASGFSVPTYTINYTALTQTPVAGLNLSGSYQITSSVGSASGTFSQPLTFDVFALSSTLLQPNGYPGSVTLFNDAVLQLRLDQAESTPLFTTTLNGTTISPLFGDAQENIDFGTPVITSTTFSEVVPEPSTWVLLLGGLNLLAFWRHPAQRA